MDVLFQNHWVAMETSNLCTKAPAIFHPTTGFLHYSAYATRKNKCAKIPPKWGDHFWAHRLGTPSPNRTQVRVTWKYSVQYDYGTNIETCTLDTTRFTSNVFKHIVQNFLSWNLSVRLSPAQIQNEYKLQNCYDTSACETETKSNNSMFTKAASSVSLSWSSGWCARLVIYSLRGHEFESQSGHIYFVF